MNLIKGGMTVALIVAGACLLFLAESCSDENDEWVKGIFRSEWRYKDRCENPRMGTDPYIDMPYPDTHGDLLDQNNWLRSWSNRTYLWYNEIIDTDPGMYDSTEAYFDTLKTTQLTSTGAYKDNFHFSIETDVYRQLSQGSIAAGYGVEWVVVNPRPPRKIIAAFTLENSPASSVNLVRGVQVVEVDGVNVVYDDTQIGVDTINAGLFPDSVGESHTFMVQDVGATSGRNITLESTLDKINPVFLSSTIDTDSGKVAYVVFNSFDALAEEQLVETFARLAAANVTDLILDLRYNGGGYVDIASQLAFMIAGEAQTSGKIFNIPTYNDKYRTKDLFTQEAIRPVPFIGVTRGFSLPSGQMLPSLNLSRVFVLSTNRTCSASEMVINSLRGIGIEVILIGGTTCGKPYGFVPSDNCGTTYFTIQIKASNHVGFGDYTDGFTPANSPDAFGVDVTGCALADDFYSALGDLNEDLLAAALIYRDSTICPPPTGRKHIIRSGMYQKHGLSVYDSAIYRRQQLLRQNLFLWAP